MLETRDRFACLMTIKIDGINITEERLRRHCYTHTITIRTSSK